MESSKLYLKATDLLEALMIGKFRRYALIVFLVSTISACVIHRVDVIPVEVTAESPIEIGSPVKAHLHDGSTVVFPEGITVSDGVVRGAGERFDLALENNKFVDQIPLDSVAAMESYQTPVNTGATAAASTASGVAWVYVGAAVLLLLFGSCPTVYSIDAGAEILEAELFSYSITPSFQARDIDKLGLDSSENGLVKLDVRNEMLETHYIDHLEIIEVTHSAEYSAYPNESGFPVVVGSLIAPIAATDQMGNDVLDSVSAADDRAWAATEKRLANVTPDDFHDHLDFEFDAPQGNDDVALVLRMRNSLLNTVLFYDVMLKEQSFGALDWMGHDLNHFGNRAEMGLWYRKHMGMTVSVWRDGKYRQIARLGDQGPIAWSEHAVEIPDHDEESIRLRLTFVADNWRIDQVALGPHSASGEVRTVPVSSARTTEGHRADIPGFLAAADEAYLINRPGDSVQVAFDVGVSDRPRTFFLASEGYYMEWMRSEWLTQEHRTKFEPTLDALMQSLKIYAEKREGLREEFESIKVPVR